MLKTGLGLLSVVFCIGALATSHPTASDAGSYFGRITRQASAAVETQLEQLPSGRTAASLISATLRRFATQTRRRASNLIDSALIEIGVPQQPWPPEPQPPIEAPPCRLRELDARIRETETELVRLGVVGGRLCPEPLPPPLCD